MDMFGRMRDLLFGLGLGLAAAFLTGCSATNQVPLPAHIETRGLSDQEQLALQQAADDWLAASDGTLALNATDGFAVVAEEKDLGGDFLGRTDFHDDNADVERISVYIDPSAVADNAKSGRVTVDFVLQTTYWHELGHVFGLPHKLRTLMSNDPDAPQHACIDAVTLADACANYGGCGPNAHSTCPPGTLF